MIPDNLDAVIAYNHKMMLVLRDRVLERAEELYMLYDDPFETDADKDELWNTYLDGFDPEVNPVYVKRRSFDCSCCRRFIQQAGGVVYLDEEQQVHTLWGFSVDDERYDGMLRAMDAYVRSRTIVGPFFTDAKTIGNKQTHGVDEAGNVYSFNHFYFPIPRTMWVKQIDLDRQRSDYRTTANVFERSMEEISLEAIDTVLELVLSNTLYKGAEWKDVLTKLREHKLRYDSLPQARKKRYVWAASRHAGVALGRIRNHSMGVLLTDLTNGVELNTAVTRYERIVAPANYKRPKAIFTPKMLEQAKNTIMEMGYLDSLPRRFAKLDDITVNNILFSNRDAARRIQGASIFDDLMAQAKTEPKKFDRVEEISIDHFLSDVLPTARGLEAYVENRHAGNFVSLIAPENRDAPSMFRWNNGFSWAYSGNITDSNIRENVKRAGGSVEGVLRFSIQWNDGNEYSQNDLDAHCILPGGEHIYFGHKFSSGTLGKLDVDIIHPVQGTAAVENITWEHLRWMNPGTYQFYVHQYTNRGGRDGFRAEIAFEGKSYLFDYPHELRQGEQVPVAEVTLKDGRFTIKELLASATASKEIWGVRTMQFVPVTVVMHSPNYWDEQSGIGNKHTFFMLRGCVNPEKPNGFYNEFLKQELQEHKRVFEALGSRMAVANAQDQLSGLGFSSTLRNELVVKVIGATERVMKIKF